MIKGFVDPITSTTGLYEDKQVDHEQRKDNNNYDRDNNNENNDVDDDQDDDDNNEGSEALGTKGKRRKMEKGQVSSHHDRLESDRLERDHEKKRSPGFLVDRIAT